MSRDLSRSYVSSDERFHLVSAFSPTGSQPEAIEKLISGLEAKTEGERNFHTLLGVTGSGKTYTVANAIEKLQKPTLVIVHNKTLAAKLYNELKEFFTDNLV